MKKMIVLAILLLSAPCLAAEVSLKWDAPNAASPESYKIYWGETSGTYTGSKDVGNVLEATIDGLENGKTYYFAATALYRDDIESGYSNEVSKLIPVVGVPGTLRITGVKVEGQLNFVVEQ